MVKCPNCGEEIDHLKYFRGELAGCNFDGEHYSNWDTYEVYEQWYECPKCGAELFDSDEDAKAFLRGDPEAYMKAMGRINGS